MEDLDQARGNLSLVGDLTGTALPEFAVQKTDDTTVDRHGVNPVWETGRLQDRTKLLGTACADLIMAWPPKAADSREAGYINANRPVSKALLRLQRRSGPYISRGDVLQHQLLQGRSKDRPGGFASMEAVR
jgi:hypothetical protein